MTSYCPVVGPFDENDAPSGWCPESGCTGGESYDHWMPLLNMSAAVLEMTPAELGDATHAGVAFRGKEFELIDRFVQHNGAGQWKRTELNVLADAIKAGVGSRWEDVHGAGSSDGNWTTTTKESHSRDL